MVSFRVNRSGAGPQSEGGAQPRTATTRRRRRGDPGCTDGGVGWNELTGFQRDLLKAIRRCAQEDTIPTGQTVKDHLERQYPGEINNGRLYQNLGYLVECDLVEKGFVDGRTNTYSLNTAAVGMLDETAHQFADICGIEVAAQNG